MSDAPRLKLCLFGKGGQKIQEEIITGQAVQMLPDRLEMLDPVQLRKEDEDDCLLIPMGGAQYLLRYYYGLHLRAFPGGIIVNVGQNRQGLIRTDMGLSVLIQPPQCGFKLDGHRIRYTFAYVDASGAEISRHRID